MISLIYNVPMIAKSSINFVSLLLLLLFFLAVPKHRAEAQELGGDSLERQPFRGTCVEFNMHATYEGVAVVNDAGKRIPRPGKPGTVGFRFDVEARLEPVEPYVTKERPQRVKCACNSKIYIDLGRCLKECRVTLGCFSGICSPYDKKEGVCLSSRLKTTFTPTLKAYVLSWIPNHSVSDACQQMRNDWNQKLLEHERRHFTEAQEVFDKYRKTWPETQIVEACGENEIEARQEFKKQLDEIRRSLDVLQEKISTEYKQKAASFHDIERNIVELDCSVCP